MYLPPHFVETDLPTLHALIKAHPLGLLISSDASGLQANPVPFLLDEGAGKKGILRAHVARANPQWQHLQAGARALIVFQGENAYITPSWYASKREHGKVVPTWNYVIVQVRGSVTVHESPDWLLQQITALTNAHESGRVDPWAVSDAPQPYIAAQMRGIVGIEIAIDEIVGKWKVSQNRSAADQEGVAQGYDLDGHAAMAAQVRERVKP